METVQVRELVQRALDCGCDDVLECMLAVPAVRKQEQLRLLKRWARAVLELLFWLCVLLLPLLVFSVTRSSWDEQGQEAPAPYIPL